jgi:hypothetical protein
MNDELTAEELANIEKRYSHVDDIWTLAVASCSTIAKDVHQLIATIREGDEEIKRLKIFSSDDGKKIAQVFIKDLKRGWAKDAEIAELKAEVAQLKEAQSSKCDSCIHNKRGCVMADIGKICSTDYEHYAPR